jgi:thiamine biosynthesis lipoprotein
VGASRRFAALGTSVEILLSDDAESLLDDVEQRLRLLEQLWSRFLPGSELSELNAAMGRPTSVSPETRRALRTAVEGYELTGGIFDPRILGPLEAAGYRTSHETLDVDTGPVGGAGSSGGGPDPLRLPLMVDIDDALSTATLPIGERWDLGGIGKGLAADLLTEELAALGAASIMVNLGGDIRVFGEALGEPCWTVQVHDPLHDGPPLADVHLLHGGVATSSRTKRRWIHEGRRRHHIIDPRSGRPAETDLVAVTVVAGATWWAEVLAKSALILGPNDGRELIERHGCSAALISADGGVVVVGDHVRLGAAR